MVVIFLVGGAHEGKMEFARTRYPESEVIGDYHLTVRQQIKEGLDPMTEIKELLERIRQKGKQSRQKGEISRDVVLISDEIGCGVIPMDREERTWREYNGRVNSYIASCADSVIRIIAGIPQKLK